MKYVHKDFDEELKARIQQIESALKELSEIILKENKSRFAEKNVDIDADFEQEGNDPFQPGYSSSISVGIADRDGELIDIHIVRIWECYRSLLGIPISINIPVSKIVGELLDETLVEVNEELKEYVEEALRDL
ncbi:hypothetical protein HNQ94_000154 [Salirhabdus euzebyi]|uniref:Uncharacterized protein n=1 Tax=Salirhabdus euzebyi TaxID=394506 RepID=A0A841Q143_9BACI|nr:hypothetical protein [Salirhabdus euzebyi]MBB6451733.1 hypothetical protein [Salirhabdus euzebyi]